MDRTRLSLALVLVVTSTSCLLDDSDGDGTNYVAISDVQAAYKDAECTYFAACGIFPDKATCLAAELYLSSFNIDENVAGGIYNGHIIYNGSKVKACMDLLAVRSCNKTDRTARVTPPECRGFFRGTLANNATCFVDEECVSQRCSGGSFGTSCSQGVCIGDTPPVTAPAEIGQDCTSSFGCDVGLYCDTVTSVCTALKASSTVCNLDTECDYGLACIGTTGPRKCTPLPAIGEPCPDYICRDEGAWCDTTANLCKPVGVAGATCTSGSECSPYYPCMFGTTYTCTQGPSLGQPCGGSNSCFDAGTFCDNTVSPVCVALKSIGESCGSSSECATAVCDFNSSVPVCAEPMSCF